MVLIWLVQLIIYPSFRYVEPASFVTWHSRYTNLISFFVGPLLLVQLGVYGWLCVNVGLAAHWVNLCIVVLLCASTAFLSVPNHSALHKKGYSKDIIDRLVFTNWPRTIGWTAIVVVDCYAWVVQSS
ncbi:MAG TPA: hypothetical protein DDW52_29065, partial [Planctomycetaceae bacterium]|nr:hypothetical protein [Planctomycetaceae bacterium]